MYGSYSSLSYDYAMSMPMDIRPSDRSSQSQEASCAFPAWPRRSCLSPSDKEQRATSFLSDEDLELQCPFEDDAGSISSSSSSSSVSSPTVPAQYPTEAELLELERQQLAYRREVARFLISEKNKRQAMRRQQRRPSTSSAKKSPKSSSSSTNNSKMGAAMTPIAE